LVGIRPARAAARYPTRPDPEGETMSDLVGVSEIARMFGVTRQSASRWKAELPEPVAELAGGPVWERATIEAWAAETGRTEASSDDHRKARLQ
jgi:hypothetical protein